MHPQTLRHTHVGQSSRRDHRLIQRTEHGSHEAFQIQTGEQLPVDGQRHLNQRGHELLFADEHGVVDAVIRLFHGVSMFQIPTRRRIAIRIRAMFHVVFHGCAGSKTTCGTAFRSVCVLVANIEFASRVTHLTLHDLQIDADSANRFARIQVKLRPVANLRDQRRRGFDRAHLTRRIRGIEAVDRRVDHEIIQRFGLFHEGTHRFRTTVDAQIARVEIVVRHGDERLRKERRVKSERVDGRLLSRRIAIEREHDARAHLLPFDLQRADQLHRAEGIVGDETAHDLGMFGAERRAAGGDGRIYAGQVHGHHVGIAFDDHDLTFLHDRGFGHIDAVQHLILVVQLGIRRIDVFRVDRIVLIQLPRAETQRSAGGVAYRPSHAAPEIVVYAALPLPGKARVEHFLLRESLAGQMAHEIVPTLGRIAASEPLAVRLTEVAPVQKLSGGERLLGHQLGYEERLGGLVRFQQT